MTTYAIIEVGGGQLQVTPGRFYDVGTLIPRLDQVNHLETMQRFLLYRILFIRHASRTWVGQPWIANAAIQGRLLQVYRDHKMIVYTMKPKKKLRRKVGYRHSLVRFVVDVINY